MGHSDNISPVEPTDIPGEETYEEDNGDAYYPEIETLEDAENHLRYLKWWKYKENLIKNHALAEVERVNAWMNKELERVGKKVAHHESVLTLFAGKTREWDKNKIRMINGAICRPVKKQTVEVVDEELFFNWVKCQEEDLKLIRQPAKPDPVVDKKEVLKFIRESGELPDGIHINGGHREIQIVTTED